jgi:sugar O-acyltransferase (sialic acid O-acetyltransferase NeuD family)
MIVIGYSGHAFVVCGILNAAGIPVTGYCDVEEKEYNPFNLIYIGSDESKEAKIRIAEQGYFISVGNNNIRQKIYSRFAGQGLLPVNALHPAAIIDKTVSISPNGIMIGAGVCINPLAEIHTGVICNTGSIIEHECVVSEFAHIGPGAVLCGNVRIGRNSFVGAGSVIRQGVEVGNNVMIGAGAVVVKNIGDNETVVGNPSRLMIK